MIDIIIPVYNEEDLLKSSDVYFQRLGQAAHLIFSDGGSGDRTAELAAGRGTVVTGRKGRGLQKNRGVEAARSDAFLFLHADTRIDPDVIPVIRRVLDRGAAGGCLQLSIDHPGRVFRFFEGLINWRARRFGIIDGDLGCFVRRDCFERAGGFDPLPYMEDIAFSRKLRRTGSLEVLPHPITVSSRKWQKDGFAKTLWNYTRAYIDFETRFRNDKARYETFSTS